MKTWQPARYQQYHWIVADPKLLGGKLALRDTRLSVGLIWECLANGMTLNDINKAFDYVVQPEAMLEIVKVASEITDSFHVAA